MNRPLVDKLAQALLYEGYILYPYRPSVKNRQRWTFGGLYPKTWSDAQEGSDACAMQTECLVSGANASLHVAIRFLHLIDRTIGQLTAPVMELPAGAEPDFHIVESLQVDDTQHQPWQEAAEREVDFGAFSIRDLIIAARELPFTFSHDRRVEPLGSVGQNVVGLVIREQQAIEGSVELSAVDLGRNLSRVRIRIVNRTEMSQAGANRDQALMRSLVSTHTILGVTDGDFVSLIDPPEQWRAEASACKNVGAWPILIGEGTEHDTMLSSPIILYDYPQVAPQSPGDLFDATEIDEILTLRIMTLTDAEKQAAGAVDGRVRELLARTESLAREQLMGLHGTLRGLTPIAARDQP